MTTAQQSTIISPDQIKDVAMEPKAATPADILPKALARPAGPVTLQKLPNEVQVMIWELCLPGPRIFEPTFKGPRESEYGVLHYKHKPPAMRTMCQVSRYVTDNHGTLVFGPTGPHGVEGCWFNPDVDIIYLSPRSKELQRADGGWCPFEDPWTFAQCWKHWINKPILKHVAFRWDLLNQEMAWAEGDFLMTGGLQPYLQYITTIETVTAIFETGSVPQNPCLHRPTAYRRLGTDDLVTWTHPDRFNETITWERAEIDIALAWEEGDGKILYEAEVLGWESFARRTHEVTLKGVEMIHGSSSSSNGKGEEDLAMD